MIRLKEEQLKIGKRRVEEGGVLLRRVVRIETTNKPVQLRREELVFAFLARALAALQDTAKACKPSPFSVCSLGCYLSRIDLLAAFSRSAVEGATTVS